LNNIKIYRTYRDYKDNLDMKIKLGLPLDFTKEQLKYLDHTIVGMNKFISGSLITIPPHPTYDDLQLAAFVRVMQMGVFNFFRRLAFSRLNMDYLLQDVQETLRQININGSFENYTNIIVNGSDEE
jgi:hypothetical protein